VADGPYIEFGRSITTRRNLRHWSVSEAARRIGVPRGCLSRWEHGHDMPRGGNRIKLRDHLGVPMAAEATQEPSIQEEAKCQLVLPFDEPANVEITVMRKTQDAVELRVVLKRLVG
jgi:transcriptional regulator with XRE-family HTH domain